MPALAETGFLEVAGQRLEYRFAGPQPGNAPTIILLHEGLGCVGLWGKFPDQLAAATGHGVFAYSRGGYGNSSPVDLPRPLSYMHDESAHILPHLLDAIGIRQGYLLGHSDGASIAAIYAGGVADHRIKGLVLIAPHFVVEDVSIRSIRQARDAYETTDLRARLARWHANVDIAFRGWNEAWLDPGFREWDISEYLAYIRVPVQIIQGADDQYGTVAQIEIAQEECYCPVDVALLEGIRHSPHREAAGETVKIVADFIERIEVVHAGSLEERIGQART